MSSSVLRITPFLSRVLAGVRVGTNLDLFLLFWTFLSGRLLASRGALFPALADFGLSDAAVRRSEAALATGDWTIAALIDGFQQAVTDKASFKPTPIRDCSRWRGI